MRSIELTSALDGGGRRFKFAPPGAPLSDVIERYWCLDPGNEASIIDLWPGTGAEIFWPMGSATLLFPDRLVPLSGPTLIALRSTRARLLIADETILIGIRLRSSALARLGARDVRAQIDRPRPLGQFIANDALDFSGIRVRSPQDAWDAAETKFLKSSSWRSSRRASIARAIEKYYYAPDQMNLSVAAQMSHTSERQLRRDFLNTVGVGPKRFQRLVRFQRTLRDLLLDRPEPCAPHALGYSDQSHQVRDFAFFAGSTPSAVRSSALTHTFFAPVNR